MTTRILLLTLLVAGCTQAPSERVVITDNRTQTVATPSADRNAAAARASFSRSVARIEPIAEQSCRQANPSYPRIACDFKFIISTDRKLGENAFQSIDRQGRPNITFTLALLQDLKNDDEVAFILGHEAGHQIAHHIVQTSSNQQVGALLLAGLLASTGQASDASIQEAANLGAYLGNRAFSKEFELEADVMAVGISARAGYDPVKGAQPFTRGETGSAALFSTHPPSAQRYQNVLSEARKQGLR